MILYCSPHPYLFFNDDRTSFTFMGFIINPQTGDLLDPQTGAILSPQALPRQLQEALIRNRVNLSENFDQLSRHVPLLLALVSVYLCVCLFTIVCYLLRESSREMLCSICSQQCYFVCS